MHLELGYEGFHGKSSEGCCSVRLGGLVLGWNKKVYARNREEMQGWAELSMFLGFFSAEKLTSELQSRENKCMAMYKKLHRWPECNALARRLLLKKWERIPAVLQKKMEQKSLLVWEWPCLVAFVVKIGKYWEVFLKPGMVKVKGRIRVRSGVAAFFRQNLATH